MRSASKDAGVLLGYCFTLQNERGTTLHAKLHLPHVSTFLNGLALAGQRDSACMHVSAV